MNYHFCDSYLVLSTDGIGWLSLGSCCKEGDNLPWLLTLEHMSYRDLSDNNLVTIDAGTFIGLTSLTSLWVCDLCLWMRPRGGFHLKGKTDSEDFINLRDWRSWTVVILKSWIQSEFRARKLEIFIDCLLKWCLDNLSPRVTSTLLPIGKVHVYRKSL